MDHDDHGDGWDEDFAAGLIGATILVGLTHRLPTGDEQEQFFGSVLTADARAGVTLLLEGERKGETFRLPPDLGALEVGAPVPHYGPRTWPVGDAPSKARSENGPPR